MKYTIAILFILVFASCLPKMRPLKDTYVDPPFQATSSNTKDVVWDKIIQQFSKLKSPLLQRSTRREDGNNSGLYEHVEAFLFHQIRDKFLKYPC